MQNEIEFGWFDLICQSCHNQDASWVQFTLLLWRLRSTCQIKIKISSLVGSLAYRKWAVDETCQQLFFFLPFHPFIELRALGEYTPAVPSLLPSPDDRLDACYDSEKWALFACSKQVRHIKLIDKTASSIAWAGNFKISCFVAGLPFSCRPTNHHCSSASSSPVKKKNQLVKSVFYVGNVGERGCLDRYK